MQTKYESWGTAVDAWRAHLPCAEASASGGLCVCRFAYPCPSCGTLIEAIGEDMEGLLELEGRCAHCFMKSMGDGDGPAAAEEPDQKTDDSWVDDLFTDPARD